MTQQQPLTEGTGQGVENIDILVVDGFHHPDSYIDTGDNETDTIVDFSGIPNQNRDIPDFEYLEPGHCLYSPTTSEYFLEFRELYTDEFGREKVRAIMHAGENDHRTGTEISLFKEHVEWLFTYLQDVSDSSSNSGETIKSTNTPDGETAQGTLGGGTTPDSDSDESEEDDKTEQSTTESNSKPTTKSTSFDAFETD